MKIFIVGPAYPYRGGIADTNESLGRSLQNEGHEVKLITFMMQYPSILFPGKTQYSPDPPKHQLAIERWIHSLNPLNWISTASKINREQPDVVIIRYWLPFLAACLGSISYLLKQKILVLGFCDNVIPHEKRPGDKQLSNYFLQSCDAFITLSQTVQEELKLFSNKKSLYLPHPINDNLGEKIPLQTALDKLKLDASFDYVLFFGLVRKYKGLDLLLKAFAQDKIKSQNIKLLVAGEFYEDKNNYLDFINKNGLGDKVHIVDQFIPTEDIKIYFSAVELVAQTYHTASQSGVSQLAYNFEKPILVTNVGGLSETVPHMKVGYVVEKDEQEIATAILDFFQKNRKEVFTKNIKLEKQKYTWKNFSLKLIDFAEKMRKQA